MTQPKYGTTFTECLRRYARANYEVQVLANSRFKHWIVGAVALGLAIVTAPFYFCPKPISFNTLYGVIFLTSSYIVTWCGGFLLFSRKRFEKLKTKEFLAYATLDELCLIDYIGKNNDSS